MSEKEYVTLKIPIELAKAIDGIVGKMGFRTRAEFAKDAIRRLLDQYASQTELEYFNLNDEGVLVLDRTLNPDRVVQVFFKPEGPWCEHCESMKCRHLEFALDIQKVQDILREKGWSFEK